MNHQTCRINFPSALFFAIATILACNNQVKSANDQAGNSIKEAITSSSGADGNCGALIFFKEGAVVEGHVLNDKGEETSKQISVIKKVSHKDGMLVSEVEMKSSSAALGDRTLTSKYMCDGNMLSVDVTSLFASLSKRGATIEATPVQFPLNIHEGQTLPDASYTFTMNRTGKTMKIITTIKNRKVEKWETITTPAGKFDCYRISSEAVSVMEGMDEKMKEAMEKMKDKMPKIHYIMWYAPSLSIVKTEFYTGDQLSSTSEIISVKN